MFKNNIIIIVMMISICNCRLLSQELDTIYHYTNMDSLDGITVLAAVTNLGVRITPAENWMDYNINKIEFFVYNPSEHVSWFEINNPDSGSHPGSTYKKYWVSFNDTSQSHPRWYSYNFSAVDSVENFSEEFWLTGDALFRTHFSNSNSGNTFVYWLYSYPCAPCWSDYSTNDITIRAILESADTTVSVADDNSLSGKIDSYMLDNHPNPFNPITTIHYELPQRSDIQITIFDLMGRKVTTLLSKTQEAGPQQVQWNATNVPSGMYFYQIRAGEYVQTRKMVLLK